MNYDLSKIRIKCAEVVGWREHDCGDPLCWKLGTGIIGITRSIHDLPNYPESADAALELVAQLEKQGWDVHVFFEGGNCSIELLSHSEHPIISSEADTFQLAACLAFLKANGINTETL